MPLLGIISMKGLWRTLFLTPILSINHPTSHTHKIVSYSPKPCFHSPPPPPPILFQSIGKLSSACKKGSLSSMTRNNKNKTKTAIVVVSSEHHTSNRKIKQAEQNSQQSRALQKRQIVLNPITIILLLIQTSLFLMLHRAYI